MACSLGVQRPFTTWGQSDGEVELARERGDEGPLCGFEKPSGRVGASAAPFGELGLTFSRVLEPGWVVGRVSVS